MPAARTRLAALLAVPAVLLASLSLAAPAQAAAARPPVPVQVGYCTLTAASLTITGGRTIAHATVHCRRKPDEFRISIQVQFRKGRDWPMRAAAISESAPFAWDPLGRAYLIRTDCVKNTRVRASIVVRARFGLHRYIEGVRYPRSRGIRTGNCDEI